MTSVMPRRPLSGDPIALSDPAAVPVDAKELEAIVEALQLEARSGPWVRTRGFSSGKAAELLERAGVAWALGHTSVPITAYEAQAFQNVLEALELYRRTDDRTARFAAVLNVVRVRLGMARVREWTVSRAGASVQWQQAPAASAVWG